MKYFKMYYAKTPYDFDIVKMNDEDVITFFKLVSIDPDIIVEESNEENYKLFYKNMVVSGGENNAD